MHKLSHYVHFFKAFSPFTSACYSNHFRVFSLTQIPSVKFIDVERKDDARGDGTSRISEDERVEMFLEMAEIVALLHNRC